MRIVLDLASIKRTAHMLEAVADEYDSTAGSLQGRHGLQGVTGAHRSLTSSTLDRTAARLRSVALSLRHSATDLRGRAERASEKRISPIYAGVSAANSEVSSSSVVALDRDNDGVTDAYAIDQDGDGRHETFVVDTDHDGRFDTAFKTDETGELVAASYDRDRDGHAEGFVGITASGVVRLTDSDLDGYHETVRWDGAPTHQPHSVMVAPRPGLSVTVDPSARSTPLTLTTGSSQLTGGGAAATATATATATAIHPQAIQRLESSGASFGTAVVFRNPIGMSVDSNYQPFATFQVAGQSFVQHRPTPVLQAAHLQTAFASQLSGPWAGFHQDQLSRIDPFAGTDAQIRNFNPDADGDGVSWIDDADDSNWFVR